ncbi:bi-domain-containing oxidoreductase [Saccharicrinis sp. FJH54]|uniref:bi-domain-containing oxidoreductase n=1 Tax=Saccharicrinis sp. FJH54 TaxID=3344665 RepID=UPI0035D51998
MKQLTQQLKSGKMEIVEVPFPALNKGYIMVRNHYSVISSGTEGKTVTDARKGYIAKARSRQKEVKQVISMIKSNGLLPTYKFVMNKLEAPSALGYSTSGEVIAVGEGVNEYQVGDWVACGGNTASHADVISVPVNLAVKVPKSVDLKQAAFSTLASIAIQGIRQSNLRFGENCLIIGMGIIGQLTYKIMEASGINPLGIDVSETQLTLARKAGLNSVYNRSQDGLEEIISAFTGGIGIDAVIITAGTSSIDPVEFAGKVARKKGRIVVVGAVPTGFSRENYYKKELELVMSSSYGPGRSDLNYEEKGQDYPVGYVRWTENRNMQSYIRLLENNRINISSMISHTFDLADSPDAYDLILSKSEPYSGILINYDLESTLNKDVLLRSDTISVDEVNVGFIGAGTFAQGTLLPAMKDKCNFIGVATSRGNTAKYVGDKYGFNYCAESADKLLGDETINTVFVTTRHNLHAQYVIEALTKNKNVFVEKPLAMNFKELKDIKKSFDRSQGNVMVGFNRRFAPAVQELKKHFSDNVPKSIVIRVNSGIMPKEHWVNDPEIGGGRIIGEACHFIDLAMFLSSSSIISVSAETMKDPNDLNNTVAINLKMKDGSIASVNYFANGNKEVRKEYIEVYSAGVVGRIDDFKELSIFGKKVINTKYKSVDKGHRHCVQTFLTSIMEGKCPISFEESYLSTLATLKAVQSINENRKIQIDEE